MRILAISDVHSWDGYERLVDLHGPDVVALAGDLTSDGGAAFWRTAFEALPAFRRDKQAALDRLGISVSTEEDGLELISGGSLRDVMSVEGELERRYRDTAAFTRARHKLHTKPFYDFLAYAGRRAHVLVVKGNHDYDFPRDYSRARINRTRGCREISGETVTVDGTTFLGLGYAEAGYRIPLRRLLAQHTGRVDVVIAHPPHQNVRLVAALKPRLLIRGHFATGRYLVDGVPSVFTDGQHAVIDLLRRGVPRVTMDDTSSESFWRRRYDWLRAYPSRRAR